MQFLCIRRDPDQADAAFKFMVQNLSFILKFIVKCAIEIPLLNEKAMDIYKKDTFKMKTDKEPLTLTDYKKGFKIITE